MMAAALSTHIAGPQQIVIVEGAREAGEDEPLTASLGRRYLPFAIQLKLTAEQRQRLESALPFVAGMTTVRGKTSIYVCRDRTCRAPVTHAGELVEVLATP
jgi:uncharacterized protein YyaL (SSP411 family)